MLECVDADCCRAGRVALRSAAGDACVEPNPRVGGVRQRDERAWLAGPVRMLNNLLIGQFLTCDGVIYIFTCVASSNVKFQIDAAGRPPIAALVNTSRPEP